MKKLIKYIIVVLVAYLAGMALFFPDHYIEQLLLEKNAGRLSWKRFSVSWGKLYFEDVRFAGYPKLQRLQLGRVVIKPQYSRFLFGDKAANIDVHADFGTLFSRVNMKTSDMVNIDFDADISEINALLAAAGSVGQTDLQGQGGISGTASLDLKAGKLLDADWRATMTNLVGYGVQFMNAEANGRMEKDVMKIDVKASGDLVVSGMLTVVPKIIDPPASTLSGILELRPGESRPGSLAATVFADGKAKRLQLNGLASKLQAVLLPY